MEARSFLPSGRGCQLLALWRYPKQMTWPSAERKARLWPRSRRRRQLEAGQLGEARERQHFLEPLAADDPGRVLPDAGRLARRGLARALTARAALHVGQAPRGRTEQLLLLDAVRTPVGAVHLRPALREMQGERPCERILDRRWPPQHAHVVQVQERDHDRRRGGGAQEQAAPVKPGISAGRWLVATANSAVMIASDVRQYGHVAPSSVTDTVVR